MPGPLAGIGAAGAAASGATGAGLAGIGSALGGIGQVVGQAAPLLSMFGGGGSGAGDMAMYAQQSGLAQLQAAKDAANALRFGNDYARDATIDALRGSTRQQVRGLKRSTNFLRSGNREAAKRQLRGLGDATSYGIQGARDAAGAQIGGLRRAGDIAQGTYDEVSGMYRPIAEPGMRALQAYDYELGLGERPEDWAGLSLTPQGRFLMEQGRDSIEAGASATGGLRSGATLQALEEYRQGLATQDRDNQLNRLAGRADTGIAAQQQIGSMRAALGDTLGGIEQGIGGIEAQRAAQIAGLQADRALGRADILANRASTDADLKARRAAGIADLRANRIMGVGDAESNWGMNAGNIGAGQAIGSGNAFSSMMGNMGGISAYNAQTTPSFFDKLGAAGQLAGMAGGLMSGTKKSNPMFIPPAPGGGMAPVMNAPSGPAFVPGMSMGTNALRFPGLATSLPTIPFNGGSLFGGMSL